MIMKIQIKTIIYNEWYKQESKSTRSTLNYGWVWQLCWYEQVWVWVWQWHHVIIYPPSSRAPPCIINHGQSVSLCMCTCVISSLGLVWLVVSLSVSKGGREGYWLPIKLHSCYLIKGFFFQIILYIYTFHLSVYIDEL